MTFTRRALFSVLLLITGSGVAAAVPALAHNEAPTSGAHHEHYGPNGEADVTACGDAAPGQAQCLARVRTDTAARDAKPHGKHSGAGVDTLTPATSVGNNGAYDPSYLQSAYNAPSATNGAGKTVAIVDAYDNPNAESDLAYYRSNYGLPPCTTDNGCFRKVDERGGTTYPAADASWGSEIALDVDMVSAMCPLCNILLVEADGPNFTDLGTAVNTAVRLGAVAVSNSYGGPEHDTETSESAAYFNHPGVAITVSTGDSGYGVYYPAASQFVTAVGGTTLTQNSNTGTRDGSETAWTGTGSGCSGYEPKPAWQHDTACGRRTVADVSAVADPATGVWAYDTYPNGGWGVMGGTSVSAPIVAAMYALASDATASNATLASAPYNDTADLNDVTVGPTKNCGNYLCIAGPGYDGPTGLGTPANEKPFSAASATGSASGSGGGTTTTSTQPTAPQSLAATAGNASVALSWTAPTTPAGATFTYNVYRSTSSTTPALVKSGLTSTSYTDTGRTNGTTYLYTVTAVSGGLESPPSAQVQATPMTTPGAPRNVSAKTSGTAGVVLTWKPPSSTGGSAVTGYMLYRATTSHAEVALTQVSCSTTTCTFTDTATTSGIVYYYQLAAVNTVGSGSLSSQVQARAR